MASSPWFRAGPTLVCVRSSETGLPGGGLEAGAGFCGNMKFFRCLCRGATRFTRLVRYATQMLPLLVAICLAGGNRQLSADPVQLRFELDTNGPALLLDAVSATGSVFIQMVSELDALPVQPTIAFHVSTPLTNTLRLRVGPLGGSSGRAFFKAVSWTGTAPITLGIPAGAFVMGSPSSEAGRTLYEGPQTQVVFTQGFRMGRCEVTQDEYKAVMGRNPAYFSGLGNRPVEQVSWTNAMDYCARLTAAQQNAGCLPTGWAYRLPTEAEWEYASRAGGGGAFGSGNELRSGMAAFDARQEYVAATGTVFNPTGLVPDRTMPVGSYAPNSWGFSDLQGNVWEWCLNGWDGSKPLAGGILTNSIGVVSGPYRVVRGGCWYNAGAICRSAYRGAAQSEYRGNDIGFRVVLVPPAP